MRGLFLSIVLTLVTFSCIVPHTNAQTSVPVTFMTNLSLGSRGAQVIALQQLLNRDPDTRIASAGPGSSGSETPYFGPLTKAAVIRLQEKYVSETLTPAGLTKGSGYVGSYTRMKLNTLSIAVENIPVSSLPTTSASKPTSTSSMTAAATTTSQNPNLRNVDKFFAAIDAVGAKQGVTPSSLAVVKSKIIENIATTTDLRAAFLNMIRKESRTTATRDDSLVGRILIVIEQAFDGLFASKHALAAAGTPFGGALFFAFPCACSNTWIITLEPLPPSYAALLTYVTGSQAFLSYNIPVTDELLGMYTPAAGVCLEPGVPTCYTIPSEGMITPTVGSSL